MLKPLKAAPYGFLRYMRGDFMGGFSYKYTRARGADVSGKIGGPFTLLRKKKSLTIPLLIRQISPERA